MQKKFVLAFALILALALAASAATVPVGTSVSVRINGELNSGRNHAGDTFDGVLQNALVVGGQTIAPRGATVRGRVSSAKNSGRIHKPGYLSIRLTEINRMAVTTNAVGRQGKGHTKSNVTKIGGGAAAGALIGALAGGGKGAAIGAGAGAGAGTGVAMYTGKKDVTLSAETAYTFTVSGASASARR